MSNTEDKSSQLPNPEDLPSEPVITELSDTNGSESAPDELSEALREKDQFKRLAQRAQADLVNYRRRIETEQQSALVRSQQRIVLRFVDVIDQLTVALKSDSLNRVDTGWLEGINAIHKKFLSELLKAMKGTKWYNKSDAMVDYFDIAYYMDINIGKWNKPYVLKEAI